MKQVLAAILVLGFGHSSFAQQLKCEFTVKGATVVNVLEGDIQNNILTVTKSDFLEENADGSPIEVGPKGFDISIVDSAGDSGASLEVVFPGGLQLGKNKADLYWTEVDMSGDQPTVHYIGNCLLQ